MEGGVFLSLHNKFDFELRDSETGELKQKGVAYNSILSSLWYQALNFLPFATHIHLGTGTETGGPFRDSLDNFLVGRLAEEDYISTDITNLYRKIKIQLDAHEFVGAVIKEVGVAYDSYETSLCTHARILDSEGQVMDIEKTDSDVLVVYATVFYNVEELDDYVKLTGVNVNWEVNIEEPPVGNSLLRYLLLQQPFESPTISVGSYGDTTKYFLTPQLRSGQGVTKECELSYSEPYKRINFEGVRFDVDEANGPIQEINIGNSFNIQLPNDGYLGTNYTDIELSGQDGEREIFVLPHMDIDSYTVEVKVNDQTQILGTDYSLVELPFYKKYLPNTHGVPFELNTISMNGEVVQEGLLLTEVDGDYEVTDILPIPGANRRVTDTFVLKTHIAGPNSSYIEIYLPNGTLSYSRNISTESTDIAWEVSEFCFYTLYRANHNHPYTHEITSTDNYGGTWNRTPISLPSGYVGPHIGIVPNIFCLWSNSQSFMPKYFDMNSNTIGNIPVIGKTEHGRAFFSSEYLHMVSCGTVPGATFYSFEYLDGPEGVSFVFIQNLPSPDESTIYTSGVFIGDDKILLYNSSVVSYYELAPDESWELIYYNQPHSVCSFGTILPDNIYNNFYVDGSRFGSSKLVSGKYAVRFETPPKEDDEISVTYRVNGVYKTSKYVLDVEGYIQLGPIGWGGNMA